MKRPLPPGTPQPLTPQLSLCEGDHLAGRYRIESLVHSRVAGAHFEATDLTSGARCSVHVLVAQPGSYGNPEQDSARIWFLAGARRAKKLTGPHVARVLDAGVTLEGHPWIVREHLGSMTLAAHLKDHGAIPTKDAVDIALAVCDAMAEAHANGIVHGSLGPHTIHVAWSASGLSDIKVVGAGTAAAENAMSLGSKKDVDAVLRAPEQITTGAIVDARADIWAVGVLLYTMLAGASPFATDTPSGASLSVILDDPPLLAGVPDELAAIVERALAKDPKDRVPSVLDFAESICVWSTNRDFAKERIDARRPTMRAMIPLADESDPTLRFDHRDAEPGEDEATQVGSRRKEALADGSIVIEPDNAPTERDPSPSTRAVIAEAQARAEKDAASAKMPSTPPPPVSISLPPPVQARPNFLGRIPQPKDVPTLITKKPAADLTPRRRAFRVLGLTTAAACVALLVLLGTEGARIARERKAAEAAAAAATSETTTTGAFLRPAETTGAGGAPTAPVMTPSSLPSATTTPAPTTTPTPFASTKRAPLRPTPASPTPASNPRATPATPAPAPAPTSDDLRRFLDDRR